MWRDTDIKEENIKSCYCCASPNCWIKQRICIKLGVPKQYVNGCTGKIAKFGDLSNYGLPYKPKTKVDKKKKPEAVENAATTVKPAINEIDSDFEEVEDSMKDFLAAKAKATTDVNIINTYGLMAYSVGMSIEESSGDEEEYTGHLTMDDWDKLSDETATDHECPVYRKGGNWNHDYLLEHIGMEHELFFSDGINFDTLRTRKRYIETH